MNASVIEHFKPMPDPRVDRTKRYPLLEIILLVITATLSGCEYWKQIKDFGDVKLDWLRRFLPYESGIPVDDTIARVMRKLNTKAFQKCFMSWVGHITEKTQGDVVSIDGKTLRRSHDKASGKAAIHMVSAWSSANGLVLGQEKTTEKSNEITAIPELLEVLEIKGCIVSIDAMGCQKSIAQKIVDKGSDYVLAVKSNQGNLYNEVKDYLEDSYANEFNHVSHDYSEESDAGHGRVECRQCWAVSADKVHMPSVEKWKKLETVVMVKSRRELKDRVTEETRFYITSLKPNADKLSKAIRQHWQVENALHWTLDVTFREDESRIRKDAAPENFAILRHIALNSIKSDTTVKASVKRKRLMAALKDDYRETLIRQVI